MSSVRPFRGGRRGGRQEKFLIEGPGHFFSDCRSVPQYFVDCVAIRWFLHHALSANSPAFPIVTAIIRDSSSFAQTLAL